MEAMLNLADDENRELTEDEQATYDAGMESVEKLASVISREEALQAAQREANIVKTVDLGGEDLGEHIESVTAGFEKDPKAGFRNMGAFALAVRQSGSPELQINAADVPKLNYLAAISGMGTTIGSDGGFTLPQQFNLDIWNGMAVDETNLLNSTDNYTVEGESLTFNASAETSRADGSRLGGMRGYWLAEAAQKTSSKPTFRQMKLEPKELAVFVYVTDKLLRGTGIALGQYLNRGASAEIAFLVSDAIINGTGAGMPLGILTSAAEVSVAKETGQAATTIVTENIVKMWARFHPRWMSGAEWLINQDTIPQLLTMSLNVGTGGAPTYLPPSGLSGAPYGTLLGKPVRPIEFCPTLGTVGDIMLVNLKAYAGGIKGGVMSDMSIHLRFDYNETAFRFVFEADGQPWNAAPLTPYKGGTNTISPFVTLATRA
jgi:HK97 family phage major capsid protein